MAAAGRGEREVDDTSNELSESVTTGAGAGAAGAARRLLAALRNFLKYLCGTSPSGRPGGIIYYSGRLDAARECLASSHEAS